MYWLVAAYKFCLYPPLNVIDDAREMTFTGSWFIYVKFTSYFSGIESIMYLYQVTNIKNVT